MLIFFKIIAFPIFYILSKCLKCFLILKPKKNIINNEEGMAVLETVPLLVVFVILMTYAMGYWGAVHSAILSSISARTYAFETFRNRSNLIKFRQDKNSLDFYDVQEKRSFRFHGVVDPSASESLQFVATRQPISFSDYQINEETKETSKDDKTLHAAITQPNGGRSISSLAYGNGVNPIWVQIGYGYCLDLECTEK